jgi:germination protein M
LNPRPLIRVVATVALLAALLSCKRGKNPATGSSEGLGTISNSPNATLFYPNLAGETLSACPVYIPPQASRQQALSALVNRYLGGPPCEGSENPYPEGSKLRAAYILEGEVAVLDLSIQARAGGGTETETLRVYGLVNTVAFNHPSLVAVRILVEGQEVDSLMGHIDLSKPIPPNPGLLPAEARASWAKVHGAG